MPVSRRLTDLGSLVRVGALVAAIGLSGLSVVFAQDASDFLDDEAPPFGDLLSPETFADYSNPAFGLEADSLPREISEDTVHSAARKLGPTPVSDVGILMDDLRAKNLFGNSGMQTFGWVEGGYSGSSAGSGLLSVQPRQNRFGNEFLLNQIGLVLIKPLKQDQFDLGFNIRYFAGADAALGQPKGGIGDPVGNEHFSQDFRDLNVSAHLPILTERGMDVKVGRMNTIIGYNGFLSPYRPFYSSDYQFFYSQDGAFTGALTNLHINDQLEIWNGVTLGANTFFTKRSSDSICYIGQINYWLTPEKRTRLTGSVYAGPNALFAAPGMAGDFDTMVELRLQHAWSEYFTQVIQSNMGWDTNTPVGTGSWYGLYTIGILHMTREWDSLLRVEWFDDVGGTRTGVNTNYAEVTLGLNWHPTKFLEVRPEIRGDFAGQPAFGVNGNHTDRNQLTGGISALVKF
ncbi:MAG: outer membrane beta-barrel protein [Planctomycetales bacterium]